MSDQRSNTEKAIQRADGAMARCGCELADAVEQLRQVSVAENYQRDDVRELLDEKDARIAELKKTIRAIREQAEYALEALDERGEGAAIFEARDLLRVLLAGESEAKS